MGCEESSKGLATADLLELIERANEGFKRGARVDYVSVFEELLVKVKDQTSGLDSPYLIVGQLLSIMISKSAPVADVVQKHVVSKESKTTDVQHFELIDVDEKLLELFKKTEEGFEQGIQANYMSGLQEMLALAKDPNSSLNNPHQIECKLLDLLKGSSVQGLEPHVKAGVAETAAKVVAKLLAHNKEKQILTSKEQKMDWLNSAD